MVANVINDFLVDMAIGKKIISYHHLDISSTNEGMEVVVQNT